MKVVLLCSDSNHPILPTLTYWMESKSDHEFTLVTRRSEVGSGDVLFLISCHEIVGKEERSRFRVVLVLHASDLPADRGWSPHIWAILRGDDHLTVSLLEADDPADSGRIWAKKRIELVGNELVDEINERLFDAEIYLMDWALQNIGGIQPQPQPSSCATNYLPRRSPMDSRLDPNRSIADQFDLLRIADPDRYPAFFEHRGRRYKVRIETMD